MLPGWAGGYPIPTQAREPSRRGAVVSSGLLSRHEPLACSLTEKAVFRGILSLLSADLHSDVGPSGSLTWKPRSCLRAASRHALL